MISSTVSYTTADSDSLAIDMVIVPYFVHRLQLNKVAGEHSGNFHRSLQTRTAEIHNNFLNWESSRSLESSIKLSVKLKYMDKMQLSCINSFPCK